MILASLFLATVTLLGTVRDSHQHPLAQVPVKLRQNGVISAGTITDQQGRYQFSDIMPGVYSVSAELPGFNPSTSSPIKLQSDNTRFDITLEASFFDEPQYTVAGVTDNTNRGGHGADTVLRSSESLAKATASLGKNVQPSPSESETSLRSILSSDPHNFSANYKLGALLVSQHKFKDAMPYLQQALTINNQDADLHHLLGDANEGLENSLEAVHSYQRAVQLKPAEPYIFDLGTELLTHLAPDAAAEAFSKGIDLFPHSTRLLLGLAVSLYSRGFYEQAAQRFFQACDINPENPEPYLFMGKVQRSEITHEDGYVSRLQRFVRLRPDNSWANYYYAVALWKQRNGGDEKVAKQVKLLLDKAIELDPGFAQAYLQQGIVAADENDMPAAATAYQQAIRLEPGMEEPHYRLAQLYKLQGKQELSQRELHVYGQLSKENAREMERQRSEIQRFVVALRNQP